MLYVVLLSDVLFIACWLKQVNRLKEELITKLNFLVYALITKEKAI